MKLERLANGNLLLKEDTDEIKNILTGPLYPFRHPEQDAVVISTKPGNQVVTKESVVLFPENLTVPAVADVDALMVELANNYVFSPASGGGGAAPINNVTFGAPTDVPVTDAATSLLAANANRKGGIITNKEGGETVYIAFGANPTALTSYALDPGESVVLDSSMSTTQEIKGICNTGLNTNVQIQEGT